MAIVRYLVDDVDDSLPFYLALGFKLIERSGPTIAILKGRGLSLWLSGPGTPARKKLPDGSMPKPGGWNRLVIEVKDLDATLAELNLAGALVRSKPIKGPGGRQALVEDPSGNPVEIIEAKAAAA